jgi:hypothetical protein
LYLSVEGKNKLEDIGVSTDLRLRKNGKYVTHRLMRIILG